MVRPRRPARRRCFRAISARRRGTSGVLNSVTRPESTRCRATLPRLTLPERPGWVRGSRGDVVEPLARSGSACFGGENRARGSARRGVARKIYLVLGFPRSTVVSVPRCCPAGAVRPSSTFLPRPVRVPPAIADLRRPAFAADAATATRRFFAAQIGIERASLASRKRTCVGLMQREPYGDAVCSATIAGVLRGGGWPRRSAAVSSGKMLRNRGGGRRGDHRPRPR